MKLLPSILLLALLGSGCADKGDDSEDPERQTTTEEAPETPPSGTLNIDLSVAGSSEDDIPDQTLLLESLEAGESALMAGYFLKGLARAIQVNLFVKAQLLIPIVMLNKARSEEAEFSGDRSWIWSYTVSDNNGIEYISNLSGTISGTDSRSWTMKVDTDAPNSQGCCDDFTFFTGSVESSTTGSWVVYDPADSTNIDKLFSIDYDYSSDQDRTIEYTLHKERSDTSSFQAGSKVTFTASGAQNTIVIDDIDQSSNEIVVWNTTTLAGSYTDTTGEKGCWAPKADNYLDVDCDL